MNKFILKDKTRNNTFQDNFVIKRFNYQKKKAWKIDFNKLNLRFSTLNEYCA